MIKCNELVPKVYSEKSFDFHLFTALLDLIFNSVDSDILAIRGLHSPKDCFDENLGRLSRFINIDTSDRKLLSKYRLMNKSKGSLSTLKSIIESCGGIISLNQDGSQKITESNSTILIILSSEETKSFNDKLFTVLIRRMFPFYGQVKVILE